MIQNGNFLPRAPADAITDSQATLEAARISAEASIEAARIAAEAGINAALFQGAATLLAGVLALIAGVAAYLAAGRQVRLSEKHHRNRVKSYIQYLAEHFKEMIFQLQDVYRIQGGTGLL